MATSMANATTNILSTHYTTVRSQSLRLIADLCVEDTVVQTMPDVSPTKWHLAHVTWFFERFVLEAADDTYRRYDGQYHYLFNSYYVTAGEMHARPKRGLLSRPTLQDVLAYREYVDAAMTQLLQSAIDGDIAARVTLGLNHEQQHQELLLTDIKHVFSCNPLHPAVSPNLAILPSHDAGEYQFKQGKSGIHRFGVDASTSREFCFDNETPEHDALLHPHYIGDRLVTNGEYRLFIEEGGYQQSALWLSDGWAAVNSNNWQRPLYWNDACTHEFTLGGLREIDNNAPVCHVSFYEADAYARWSGARLPTEFEWESAARERLTKGATPRGNFLESNAWHPMASKDGQFFGDVWEWTSSPYAPYPGFKPLDGSLGEYNGKFMCNQMTVRGGSCVTASDHTRSTYRSFFYPDARWQFLGIRLAKDHSNES